MLSTLQTKVLLVAILTVFITLYRFHQTTSSILQWQASSGAPVPVTAPSSPTTTTTTTVNTNTMAPYLSPKDLMSRPLPGPNSSIPKLFHQSWSSKELPAKFAQWSETCRRMHPDWEWVLWTDDDNRELVERFVPGMKGAYEDLRGPIFRADVVRNAYLFLFGGVYADLDMECLRPADSMFATYKVATVPSSSVGNSISTAMNPTTPSHQKAFVGQMGTDTNFEHAIPNAWMASPPGHPFYHFMMRWATKKITSGDKLDSRPEAVTGPIALRAGIERFRKGHFGVETLLLPNVLSSDTLEIYTPDDEARLVQDAKVEVLPPHLIYPYSWHRDGDTFRKFCWSTLATFNATKCKEVVAVEAWGSVTITYWSHTWNGDGPNEGNLKMVESMGDG